MKNNFDRIVYTIAFITMVVAVGFGVGLITHASNEEYTLQDLKDEYQVLQDKLDMNHQKANDALHYYTNSCCNDSLASVYKFYLGEINKITIKQQNLKTLADGIRASTPKPQPGPGPISGVPNIGDTINAEISYYTCDKSMSTVQKRMNCPSLLSGGVPRTATGTYPTAYKTLACNPRLWGTEWRINHLNVIARCEDTGGHFGYGAKTGRFDLYVGEANGDYYKALTGQRWTTITRVK